MICAQSKMNKLFVSILLVLVLILQQQGALATKDRVVINKSEGGDVKMSSVSTEDMKFESHKMEDGGALEESTDEIKIESIKMDSSTQGFKSYQSPELKREQNFKYYNNTYMYVSFRADSVAPAGQPNPDQKKTTRELFQTVVADYLKNAQANESKLTGVNLRELKLKQAYDGYVMIEVSSQKDMKKIANNLKLQTEVLAVEWLDKKKIFGDKASLDEMSSFKSKVKKQPVQYDPEKEKKAAEDKERQERELTEKMEKEFEEIKKTGNFRQPQPYMGKDKQDEL